MNSALMLNVTLLLCVHVKDSQLELKGVSFALTTLTVVNI